MIKVEPSLLTVSYVDELYVDITEAERYLDLVIMLLHKEAEVKKKSKFINAAWKKRSTAHEGSNSLYHIYPRQRNGYDCGMFVLVTILYSIFKIPLQYTESDLTHYRKLFTRMAITDGNLPIMPDDLTNEEQKTLKNIMKAMNETKQDGKELRKLLAFEERVNNNNGRFYEKPSNGRVKYSGDITVRSTVELRPTDKYTKHKAGIRGRVRLDSRSEGIAKKCVEVEWDLENDKFDIDIVPTNVLYLVEEIVIEVE